MTDLISKVKEYREMKRLADEAQAVADAIADELKAVMTNEGADKLVIGEYKLSYTDCIRRDIDKKRLEQEAPGIYNAYIKETSYKRFAVC